MSSDNETDRNMALAGIKTFKQVNKIHISEWEDCTMLQVFYLQNCEVQSKAVKTLFRYPRIGMLSFIICKNLRSENLNVTLYSINFLFHYITLYCNNCNI